MNILLYLAVVMLGPAAAQIMQDDGDKEWTQEEIDAIYANASHTTATTPEMVAYYNYTCEIHHVITTDGYVLEMHRISGSPACPPAEGKPVVFLMHGFECSSFDWILLGLESLALILANAGYDVWMGNARGNTYSRKHIPEVSREEFWDFSWHEIGYYDLPAMIDYTLAKTEQEQLIYIGHSQGTTSVFVTTSTRPEYNEKLNVIIALAPLTYVPYTFNPVLRALSTVNTPLQTSAELLGVYELLPSPRFIREARAKFCENDVLASLACELFIFLFGGFDRSQLDVNLMPMIAGHTPAGSSVRQLFHYLQLMRSGNFSQYDFGRLQNMIRYHSATPPDYNISLITTPVHFYCGKNDWVSAIEDVTRLYHELPNAIELRIIDYPEWAHLDFIYGKDAKSYVYDPIIDTLANSYGLPSSCPNSVNSSNPRT